MASSKRPDGGASRFEYLARGVDIDDRRRRSRALNLRHRRATATSAATCPAHDLAANLIGFTGEDLTGLEAWRRATTTLLRGTRRQAASSRSATAVDLATEIPGGYQPGRPRPSRAARCS